MIFQGFGVSIFVAGKFLEEYGTSQPNEREQTCYIASERGKVQLSRLEGEYGPSG